MNRDILNTCLDSQWAKSPKKTVLEVYDTVFWVPN